MSEDKIIDITVKYKSRNEMMTNLSDYILKDRELLVETDGENETLIVRFKLGDGKTVYSQLPYVSNIYKLYPNFRLYSNNYDFGININLKPVNKEGSI